MLFHNLLRGCGAVLLTMLFALPAAAQQTQLSQFDRSVFFFGGRFHSDWFGTGLKPWEVNWEDNYIVAAGYQQTLLDWYDFRVSAELGASGRFGTPQNSLEVWAAASLRYDGFVVGNLRISPSISVGFSAVTAPIGIEALRAQQQGISVPILVYLGPEIALSLVDNPQWEIFWRLQHRSGGYGAIANIDGSNADVLGIRYKFN